MTVVQRDKLRRVYYNSKQLTVMVSSKVGEMVVHLVGRSDTMGDMMVIKLGDMMVIMLVQNSEIL